MATKEEHKIRQKECPRCGETFSCNEADIAHCQCAGINLSAHARQFLKSRYSDCLCRNCLIQISKLLPICLLLCLISCHKMSQPQEIEEPFTNNRYATGFSLVDSADCCIATIYSPWEKGKTMGRYVISKQYCQVAVTSCTQVGFITALGAERSIVGACNPELIYSELGELTNLGDAMSPNVERIIGSKAQAIFVSTYAQDDVATKQLSGIGIPVIYVNEWTEKHPLARAEWIKLIGAFLGCRLEADSIFNIVEERYLALKDIAKRQDTTIQVMSGQDFRGTWYVPSENSFMGCFLRDAGASKQSFPAQPKDSHLASATSIPLSMERALQEFAEAEIWIGVNAYSLAELQQIDEKHTWFKAFKNGQVYNFLAQANEKGANQFWERGVVHPEEILHDLIVVLHPSLSADGQEVLGISEDAGLDDKNAQRDTSDIAFLEGFYYISRLQP